MRFLKRSIIVMVVVVFVLANLWTLFAFSVRDKYVVPILMYHRVAELSAGSKEPACLKGERLNTVSSSSFDHQMAYLKNNGYVVISLADFVEGFHKARLVGRKTVVITFDDGYEDNYINALPILRKYDFSATIFVIADLIGMPGFMNVSQLKEINDNGFKVGSHTRRHTYLPDVPPNEQEEEIINSKKILEEKLGRPVEFFSYPSGGFSESIKAIVKKAGYVGACATNRGYDRFNNDVYELKRIRINDDDIDLVLFAKLSGYYNIFRKSKNPN